MGNATFVLGLRREVSLRPALNVSFTSEIQRTDAGLIREEAKGPDAEEYWCLFSDLPSPCLWQEKTYGGSHIWAEWDRGLVWGHPGP